MTDKVSKSQSASQMLYQQLARSRKLRNEQITESKAEFKKLLFQLREWQVIRLSKTYDDLLNSPRHKLAAEFFLTDLYGPKDFSQRDRDIERSYPLIISMLPEPAIHTIAVAIEVDVLSQELDVALLHKLIDDLGVKQLGKMSEETYAQAYYECGNYDDRKLQITLIQKVGKDLDVVVAKPYIYAALCLARTPAKFSGFGELQDFLERGFKAFRHMQGADEFLNTILSRELAILERIYSNHPTPFALD